MAAIINARDVILQATSPRIVPVTLPPNVTVPNGQVDGLGNLALQNQVNAGQVGTGAVTASSMAANSITAANGAIGDLSVDRIKITGMIYSPASISFVNGVASGRTYHYSNRKIIPIATIPVIPGFDISGINILFMDDFYFDWKAHGFAPNGAGYNGTQTIYWGYL